MNVTPENVLKVIRIGVATAYRGELKDEFPMGTNEAWHVKKPDPICVGKTNIVWNR